MGEGTDIVFVADDGYKTILPYTSIYTTPDVRNAREMPSSPGMLMGCTYPDTPMGCASSSCPRTPSMASGHARDHAARFWHYYYQSYLPTDPVYGQYAPGILYPSCAGLSAKYVARSGCTRLPNLTGPAPDGTRVGGIETP
jgi:hypothetical protein